jgi:PKD repeat protein
MSSAQRKAFKPADSRKSGLDFLKSVGLRLQLIAVITLTCVTVTGCVGLVSTSRSAAVVPSISSFGANPTRMSSGGNTVLSWTTSGATSIAITPGTFTSTLANGSITVSPTTTTIYTLTASNGAGVVTATVTVTLTASSGPTINSFSVNPTNIAPGASSTLSWSTNGATSVAIMPGAFTSSSASGVMTVTPANTTTYTLTATNANGSATATVTVTVTASAGPTINSFSANPTSITSGASSTLSWATSGATSIAITPGTFTSTSGNGSTTVTPASTTTYTLTATNITGSATATATVTVGSSSASACSGMSLGVGANLNGFVPFPASNAWNKDISSAAVDPNSGSIINYIGGSAPLHPDFNSSGGGIPYIVVDSLTAPLVNITLADSSQSDLMPMPFPPNAPIESGSDHHVLVLDRNTCWLYEVWLGAFNGGQWSANNSAAWDLLNYNNRPYTWTSADAAGLPIFPGLVRYDEVASGVVNHAFRFTVPNTWAAFVAPATHWAATNSGSPIPMGMRIRLKASISISGFSAANQVILTAMKKYGLIMADNGSAMYVTGVPDTRWNDSDLHNLTSLTAADFEVVQMPAEISSSNVPLGAAPVINSFTASANTVSAGTAVTLSWNATGVSYYYISPSVGTGVGIVRGSNAVVNPTVTTTYTLNTTNAYGRATANVSVNVQ